VERGNTEDSKWEMKNLRVNLFMSFPRKWESSADELDARLKTSGMTDRADWFPAENSRGILPRIGKLNIFKRNVQNVR